jgi:hypothetical protein
MGRVGNAHAPFLLSLSRSLDGEETPFGPSGGRTICTAAERAGVVAIPLALMRVWVSWGGRRVIEVLKMRGQ